MPASPILPTHSHSGTSTPTASQGLYTGGLSPHRTGSRERANGSGDSNGSYRDEDLKDALNEKAFHGKEPAFDLSTAPKKAAVKAATIVPIWIALSSAVIIYNKYLYSNLNFPYPIFITSYHLGCAALGTRLLRATTNLMDGLDRIPMTREIYVKSILPIGVLFSGSLILSNSAYLTLSVSFIQMLKAFTPVSIVLISAVFRIQALNTKLLAIVCLISTGCALAAYGEVHFNMLGFVFQTSAVVFESSRLVMIEILLQGLKMDPLCSLHYYAPVCAIINACFIPFTEGMAPFRELGRIGFFIMSTNALVAFGLNVAAVFLIGAAGGLVLTLAGVFKDILLISSSVIFFGSSVTPVQVFGYSLALTGLMIYKNTKK